MRWFLALVAAVVAYFLFSFVGCLRSDAIIFGTDHAFQWRAVLALVVSIVVWLKAS